MALTTPATDHTETIRAYLAANGIENVVAGQRWPIGADGEEIDRAVIILEAPGLPPIRLLNGGESEIKRDGIQIMVRGDHANLGEVKTRANKIYGLMRFAADVWGDPYFNVEPLGGIQRMDPDEEERPRVSLNYYLHLQE